MTFLDAGSSGPSPQRRPSWLLWAKLGPKFMSMSRPMLNYRAQSKWDELGLSRLAPNPTFWLHSLRTSSQPPCPSQLGSVRHRVRLVNWVYRVYRALGHSHPSYLARFCKTMGRARRARSNNNNNNNNKVTRLGNLPSRLWVSEFLTLFLLTPQFPCTGTKLINLNSHLWDGSHPLQFWRTIPYEQKSPPLHKRITLHLPAHM